MKWWSKPGLPDIQASLRCANFLDQDDRNPMMPETMHKKARERHTQEFKDMSAGLLQEFNELAWPAATSQVLEPDA